MKKTYLIAFLCGLLGIMPAHAQSPGADSLRQKLNTLFANIDKSQVPTGYLYEASARLLPLHYFTTAPSDSNLLTAFYRPSSTPAATARRAEAL